MLNLLLGLSALLAVGAATTVAVAYRFLVAASTGRHRLALVEAPYRPRPIVARIERWPAPHHDPIAIAAIEYEFADHDGVFEVAGHDDHDMVLAR